jgi:hypothetical protein
VERLTLAVHAMRNRTITPFARVVLSELVLAANPKQVCVWVSVDRICRIHGARDTTVYHVLQELEQHGYIVTERSSCPCGRQKDRPHYRLAALAGNPDDYLDEAEISLDEELKREHVANDAAEISSDEQVSAANTSSEAANTSSEAANTNSPHKEHGKEHGKGTKSVALLPPAARRTRIPEDFPMTDDMRVYALKVGLQENELEEVHEDFCTYWRGCGRPMLNWVATWQNRMRVEAGRRKAQPYKYATRQQPRQRPSSLGSAREETANPVYYEDLERRNQPSRPREAF